LQFIIDHQHILVDECIVFDGLCCMTNLSDWVNVFSFFI